MGILSHRELEKKWNKTPEKVVKYSDYLALQKQLHDLEDADKIFIKTLESRLEECYQIKDSKIEKNPEVLRIIKSRRNLYEEIIELFQAIKNSEERNA
jgi:uncharacterized protein involved in tolerance to divalent cations